MLEIDTYTSTTLHGRYARICIQFPMNAPIKKPVTIKNHKQEVFYEREGTLCASCGWIDHTLGKCTN